MFAWPKKTASHGDGQPFSLFQQMIGGEESGKSTLLHALTSSLVGSPLGSGLFLSAGDTATLERPAPAGTRAVGAAARRRPAASTQHERQLTFQLYDGGQCRLNWHLQEVIGQVLTHTETDSPEEQQRRYQAYCERLQAAHALWCLIPAPPADQTGDDMRRFRDSLRTNAEWLHAALRGGRADQPCATALVLVQTDRLYDTAAAAQAALTDDVLRRVLGPLIRIVETSPRVTEGAVFVVSSLGYGCAEPQSSRETAPRSTMRRHQTPWILKDGREAEPHNVLPLGLWTLLASLLHQETSAGEGEALADVARMLCEDLIAAEGWFMNIKGPMANVTAA